MEKCLIYEDESGYCRLIVPSKQFKQDWESIQNAMARLHNIAIPSVTEFYAVDIDQIPKDETFREAWVKGTIEEPIKFNLDKAKEIHKKRIQEACLKKIEQLNLDLEKALEDENTPAAVAARRTKKIFRTYHDEINLTHCKTIQDVKYAIPKELYDSWPYYNPTPQGGKDESHAPTTSTTRTQ